MPAKNIGHHGIEPRWIMNLVTPSCKKVRLWCRLTALQNASISPCSAVTVPSIGTSCRETNRDVNSVGVGLQAVTGHTAKPLKGESLVPSAQYGMGGSRPGRENANHACQRGRLGGT